MHYVYVIQSLKDKGFYTGYTTDLKRRLEEHNSKSQSSTKSRVPFNLVYYEWCLSKGDAITREKYLKSGKGKRYIKDRVKYYLAEVSS
ncbi:MAG: GIY-YIG nuclease family protein [Candidatus Omnitrophota bacterium]|nr:GIY-YIG nuclease family protein [Candidatus Omnitrophota bacterium]